MYTCIIEKAFDRVETLYLKLVINDMAFGNKFTQEINSLYASLKAQVKINVFCSCDFRLHKGTYQDHPLSPLLFTLSFEPLATNIKNTIKIKGIFIKE